MGFETGDDACVYRVSDTLALVQTVDFFPPVVDDPYAFGQISAANALSDVYAMGGDPKTAMNLLCYPTCLPPEVVGAILAGGGDKVREAGAVLAGGHTIQDPEPKYGLCVTGFVNPQKLLTNAGARPGDRLLLTKPLGTGVLVTAAKADLIDEAAFAAAVASMAALNRTAAELAAGYEVHACTDVTGFGLLGHACEMAEASGVTIRLYSGELPLLEGARELAEMGILPAGAHTNMGYVKERVSFADSTARALRDLMADPQTSGGLLLAVAEPQADELYRRLRDALPSTRMVGEVTERGARAISVE